MKLKLLLVDSDSASPPIPNHVPVVAAEVMYHPEADEKMVEWLKGKHGDAIVVVLCKDKPYLIKQDAKVLRDGAWWCLLIDFLTNDYPLMEFTYDDNFMNIQIKQPTPCTT